MYRPLHDPRTRRGRRRAANPQWTPCVRNHARAAVACDFCVAVAATCQVLSVFVALEMGSQRLVHITVASHPTAAWILQPLREDLAMPPAYRFVLRDRDSIYAHWLAAAVPAMGVRILQSPVQAATANAYCERLLGNLRRACLDCLIPVGEEPLGRALRL